MRRLRRDVEDFFRRAFSFFDTVLVAEDPDDQNEEIVPTVYMFEEGNDIVVKADLPGMKKGDRGEKKNSYRAEYT